jgi:homoaconitase/3-isopropylmalate dehydratase large subunit
LAPKVIAHDPLPVADKVHRPARFSGGGMACGVATAVLAGVLPPTAKRSLSLQAASRLAHTMIGTAADEILARDIVIAVLGRIGSDRYG